MKIVLFIVFSLLEIIFGYNLTRGSCPEDYVQCERGINWRDSYESPCLNIVNVCDNHMDCTDGSDEKYCPENFNFDSIGFTLHFVRGVCEDENSVMCINGSLVNEDHIDGDKRCFKNSWICDKDKDCSDDISDFKFCPYNTDFRFFHFQFSQKGCPKDFYRCKTSEPKIPNLNHSCISKKSICDGNQHCIDGSDEFYCPYFFEFPPSEMKTFQQEDCPENYYKCIRGKPKHKNNLNNDCIMKSWICDGNKDCFDNSDERHCPYNFNLSQPTTTETITPSTDSDCRYLKRDAKPYEIQTSYPLAIHFYIFIFIICLVTITSIKVYSVAYNFRIKGNSASTYHLNHM